MDDTDPTDRQPASVTDGRLFELFRRTDDPVLSTREVAEALPLTRRRARSRLETLHAVDAVGRKRVGDDAVVWWLGEASPEPERRASPATSVAVERAIAEIDTPGDREKRVAREAALRDLYRFLRERGAARRSEFADLVDPETVAYASFDAFWNDFVLGHDALARLPGVTAPSQGQATWTHG